MLYCKLGKNGGCNCTGCLIVPGILFMVNTFFSEQARKPTGLFGRFIMSIVFNIGNVNLNRFVIEQMSVQENDHILEIGFGTGKLIYEMAKQIDKGLIEGIDFSSTMVATAQRRNQKQIKKVKLKS